MQDDDLLELAVALLGGHGLAEPLAQRLGIPVAATDVDNHLDVAAEIGGDDVLVVGLAAVPWPVAPDLHALGSAELPAYTGVVSWYALPTLHERLAQAAAPGARAGAHVLITAPDPGDDLDPSDIAFLRHVAEGIESAVSLPSRSIAWRGDTRTPTAVHALTNLVEVHGRRDVVEVPVAPGTGADAALMAVADELGARLTCVDLGRGTQLELLHEVVATVAGYEGFD